jgi:hypothetical protein
MQLNISYLLVRFIVRGAHPTHLIHLEVITAVALSDECKYAIT